MSSEMTRRSNARMRNLVPNDDGQLPNISSQAAHVNDVSHRRTNVINGRGRDKLVSNARMLRNQPVAVGDAAQPVDRRQVRQGARFQNIRTDAAPTNLSA